MKSCIDKDPKKCAVTKEFLEDGDFGTMYRCPMCFHTELDGGKKVHWFLTVNIILMIIMTILSISMVTIAIFKPEWIDFLKK